MTRSSGTQTLIVWATLAVSLVGVSTAFARIIEPNEPAPTASQSADLESPASALPDESISSVEDADETESAWALDLEKSGLVPEMSADVRTWLAIVVILVLLLRLEPLATMHNLDVLVLAVLCALLLARGDELDVAPAWVYVALSVTAVYWLFRGLQMFARREIPMRQLNLTRSATLVLIAAGLLVAFDGLLRAPISGSSRDGIAGGLQVVRTGKLPYGIVADHDSRAPMIYLAHAGGIWLGDTGAPEGDRLRDVDPADDALWQVADEKGIAHRVVLLVNSTLLLAFLGALCVIGVRLHSPAMSGVLIALTCVFPGAAECFVEPAIMVPAVMLAWSVAFAMMGGLGGLLSMLMLVMAGMAWPWAWCAVPVLAAYLMRQGLQALGMIIGLLGGIVACVAGTVWLVAPDLPRADGALLQAGMTPRFVAQIADDGGLVIEAGEYDAVTPPTSPAIKQRLWRGLLEFDGVTLDGLAGETMLPNGDDADGILYRDVVPEPDAQERLVAGYRNALAEMDDQTRFWVAARTMLEATYLPMTARQDQALGTWQAWALRGGEDLWRMIRRSVKIGLAVLVVIIALALLGGGKRRPHHLIGAMLMIISATLLVSWHGAVTNWVWPLPLILAALVAHTEERRATQPGVVTRKPPAGTPKPISTQSLPELDFGPAPRITVEKK